MSQTLEQVCKYEKPQTIDLVCERKRNGDPHHHSYTGVDFCKKVYLHLEGKLRLFEEIQYEAGPVFCALMPPKNKQCGSHSCSASLPPSCLASSARSRDFRSTTSCGAAFRNLRTNSSHNASMIPVHLISHIKAPRVCCRAY